MSVAGYEFASTTSAISSTISSIVSSATSAAAKPTVTNPPGQQNGQGGSGSKPLLFFVALGFGVVFTNLWIIVGVKYCFRYNQRARALAALGENGENEIDMNALTRPRRRKERKIMTMEEVNERFPLTKYKVWRATREAEGLPAEGGVTATPSRAASIRESAASFKEVDHEDEHGGGKARPSISHLEVQPSSAHIDTAQPRISTSSHHDFANASTSTSALHEKSAPLEDVPLNDSNSYNADATNHNPTVEDEADDPIHAAINPALEDADPGDACAVCLDTLEDDDEVRGLTCGHCYHAGCLDPWLTGRRACCPLCKSDYYIPKPRADGTTPGETPGIVGYGDRIAPPISAPRAAWIGGRGFYQGRPNRTFIMGGRLANVNNETGEVGFIERPLGLPQQREPGERRGWGSRMTNILLGNSSAHLPWRGEDAPRRRSRNSPQAEAIAALRASDAQRRSAERATAVAEESVTPGQLEAGSVNAI